MVACITRQHNQMCMVVFMLQLNQIVIVSIVSPTMLVNDPLEICIVQPMS